MCIFHYILSLSSAQIIKNLQLLLLYLLKCRNSLFESLGAMHGSHAPSSDASEYLMQ